MTKATVKVSVSDTSSSDESEHPDDEMAEISVHSDSEEADDSGNDTEVKEEPSMITNEGWADSVAKILGSKKPKNKKTLVLSRAKKHSEILKKTVEEKPSFDVVGEVKEEKPKVLEVKTEIERVAKKRKLEKPSIRVKPNILEKDRERLLAKIATKGVVQLFNAVKNQQKSLEKQVDQVGLSEGKKDKILKNFDKRTFLDTLMGQTKSTVVDDKKKLKSEVKDERTPKWNALRDDFMMGAKMKDWDKVATED